jgi:hypothetical protein
MHHRVLIDLESLQNLPKSGKRREDVIKFCASLASQQYEASDFQIKDPQTQRTFEVSITNGFAIYWWVDSPVKRIVIVEIRKLK